MSFLFGGGSKVKPEYTGINTQTSSSVVPLPLTWGQCRVSPNLMDYTDFKSHKVKAGGKGFGGVTGYTYSATIVMGLSEGPIGGVLNVWKDSSSQETTTLAKLGFTLFTGTIPQAPWGYMVANHPDHALNYAGICYVAAANYDLGQSASTPQHSFELKARQWHTGVNNTIVDADPAVIFDEYLTRPVVGCNYPTGSIDYTSLYSSGAATTTGDAAFQTYCRAMGFGMSPALTSQEDGGTILDRWCKICNTAPVFDGYQLGFVPYCYQAITANGVTFLPQTASDYVLTDDDYVSQGKGSDPILIKREPVEYTKNQLYFECLDRSNQYNPVPVEWVDQALVDQFGPLPDSSFSAHEICDPTMAGKMATLMGERNAFERNEFTFYLSPAFSLLKPTSLLTVNDPLFGSVQIRVDTIEEQDNGDFKVIGKMIVTQGNTAGFNVGTVTSTVPDAGVTASNVNTPMIFQPPPKLTNNVPQLWAALCGGGGTYDPNWGGCDIYASTDGGVSYNKVGTFTSPTRMGVLAAGLAAYGGANPDTIDTLKVDVTESAASFSGSTATDAAAGVTLCRIAPEGANAEEYVAYQNATLNSPNNYWFDHLYRGLYGSVAGAHGTGAQFARLDSDLVFKYTYPQSLNGQTVHFKFVSFNIYGKGYQDISTVTDYPYTIGTVDYGTVITTPSTASPTTGDGLVWNGTAWVPGAQMRWYGGLDGQPTAGQKLFEIEMKGDESFAAGFPQNAGGCDTAPAGNIQCLIKKNGATVGHMDIAAGATVATWTLASGLTFAAGDRLSFFAPTSVDATLAGLFYTFIGTRT